MRRDSRRRNDDGKDSFKLIIYLAGGVLAIAVITFVVTFLLYNSKVNNSEGESVLSTEQISDLIPNTNNTTTEPASTGIGKTVNELENSLTNTQANNVNTNTTNTTSTENNTTVSSNTTNTTKTNTSKTNTTTNTTTTKNETKTETKEVKFIQPVEGEVIKKFAKDNLVFSETLQEWETHLGIDIKADKTTVVKVAADGVVEAIKNDPRYGLTVIIAHDNGLKSVYSNLLTAEFVTENEEVKSGQTLGTVGNSAAFEIADEPHLHFEILKDNEKVDPTIYVKY